jgi:hypothetical protein
MLIAAGLPSPQASSSFSIPSVLFQCVCLPSVLRGRFLNQAHKIDFSRLVPSPSQLLTSSPSQLFIEPSAEPTADLIAEPTVD